jgi:hypothetical protein
MAKSIRSKVKRRFRTAKRGLMKRTVLVDKAKPVLKKLERAAEGIIDADVQPRNAFRSDEPDAIIPQKTFTPCTDFRSAKVLEAQYATSGNRRVTHPLHLLEGAAAQDGEPVLAFGPGGSGAEQADEEELADAPAPVPFEDDRMNYDGTTKCSSRMRRRNRNKGGSEAPGQDFAFWGRKSEKR